MKAIQIKRTERNYFMRAARIAGLDVQELKTISCKDYVFFFVVSHSQDSLFKLGIIYNNLCLEANHTTIN